MRKTYRILGGTMSVLVVVQAMMIVFVISGLFHWIDDGNTLDQSVVDSWEDDPPTFFGSFGGFLHFFLIGTVLIPLLALIMLIVSFFAKIPRGTALALGIVVSVVVQVLAGQVAASAPLVGMIHGLNAFILFGLGLAAAKAAKNADAAPVAPAPA